MLKYNKGDDEYCVDIWTANDIVNNFLTNITILERYGNRILAERVNINSTSPTIFDNNIEKDYFNSNPEVLLKNLTKIK